MSDLIAQGPQPTDRWRRALPPVHEGGQGREVRIGRVEGTWQVGWDDRISREHAAVRQRRDGAIDVRRLPAARNPIFYRGQRSDAFVLSIGEHFVIGRTTFTLTRHPVIQNDSSEPLEVTEHQFDPAVLRQQGFRDAGRRIEVLARLPELIAGSTSDQELLVRVAGVLLQATPSASAVAILDVESSADNEADGTPAAEAIRVLHYDSRAPEAHDPKPSARLARSARQARESVLHVWDSRGRRGEATAAYTAREDVDWAFCVPVTAEACRGWVLYVTGQLGTQSGVTLEQSMQAAPVDLRDDLKFAELVATTLGNLRQVRSLQRRQAGLRRFFAPVVMDALATRDADQVLEPREADVAVLFCDLRGFSRRSEESSDDLLDLLHRVSEALGVMTRHILDRDGVVGDFHGDAAMGFWGWPLEQADASGRACRAALAINQEFLEAANGSNRPMSGFRCGIGIATGRAVAGRIGTIDQVKVTAFGPVVNLASRLEGMTRPLAAEILMDEATAGFVRDALPPDVARVRRLLRVRPAGFHSAVNVFQLLPPEGSQSPLTAKDLEHYEAAVEALIVGHWEDAFELLHEVTPEDRAKDFLTATITRHGRAAPTGWDGVIDLPKG